MTGPIPPARIYLAPGFFAFERLAGIEYFRHVAAALEKRFDQHGRELRIRVADVHPSASIRRRAALLPRLVAETAGSDDGPIHLLGHSIGGLDVRLAASPGGRLDEGASPPEGWPERLRSVTAVNTPHCGTPLAAFFGTAKGAADALRTERAHRRRAAPGISAARRHVDSGGSAGPHPRTCRARARGDAPHDRCGPGGGRSGKTRAPFSSSPPRPWTCSRPGSRIGRA